MKDVLTGTAGVIAALVLMALFMGFFYVMQAVGVVAVVIIFAFAIKYWYVALALVACAVWALNRD